MEDVLGVAAVVGTVAVAERTAVVVERGLAAVARCLLISPSAPASLHPGLLLLLVWRRRTGAGARPGSAHTLPLLLLPLSNPVEKHVWAAELKGQAVPLSLDAVLFCQPPSR